MNTRTAGLSLYPHLAPMRWLKVAATYADQGLANFCAHHWRNSLVPVAIPVPVRRPRAR